MTFPLTRSLRYRWEFKVFSRRFSLTVMVFTVLCPPLDNYVRFRALRYLQDNREEKTLAYFEPMINMQKMRERKSDRSGRLTKAAHE